MDMVQIIPLFKFDQENPFYLCNLLQNITTTRCHTQEHVVSPASILIVMLYAMMIGIFIA